MLQEHFKKILNVEELDLSESQIKIKDEFIKYERTINLQNELFTDFDDTELDGKVKLSINHITYQNFKSLLRLLIRFIVDV